MDSLRERVEMLEQQTRAVERQLRWWRGLSCGLVVLGLLAWALPSGTAQEEPSSGRHRGGFFLLAQRVAALEHKLRHLTSATDEQGRDEVVITRANLRIVNGLGETATTNGLGNLIVGYNEPRIREDSEDPNVRTGSHNVVVGQQHNFSRFGGLVVGLHNEISGDFAVVSGGSFNTASGSGASVSGGSDNTASICDASVSGGANNTASDFAASVSGGFVNTARNSAASVSGGQNNTASGLYASVSGGLSNTASGDFASVSGGQDRSAPGEVDWAAGDFFADF